MDQDEKQKIDCYPNNVLSKCRPKNDIYIYTGGKATESIPIYGTAVTLCQVLGIRPFSKEFLGTRKMSEMRRRPQSVGV